MSALYRHRWLLARRACQLGILALFAFGAPYVKGTLASSMTLGVLPLTDPFVLLQSLAAGHMPIKAGWIGAAIVALFYALLGGRAYCGWVCPVNLLTDLAGWLRRVLGLNDKALLLPRQTRLWIMAAALAVSALTGTIAWEAVNPVTLLQRGLTFGLPLGILAGAAVLLVDLTAGARTWCGHLCPVGAFYGLLGRFSLLRFSAKGRSLCDDCGDCYRVCPEPHCLSPALRGEARGIGPLVASGDCSLCGRCADVCSKDVLAASLRLQSNSTSVKGECPP